MIHFEFKGTVDYRTIVSRSQSGRVKEMIVNAHHEEVMAAFDLWINGMLIQDAMPFLSQGEREFFISGITPGEWELMFGEES